MGLGKRSHNPAGFGPSLRWGRVDPHTNFRRRGLDRHCQNFRPAQPCFHCNDAGAASGSQECARCPWRSRRAAVRRAESRDATVRVSALIEHSAVCRTQLVPVVIMIACARLGWYCLKWQANRAPLSGFKGRGYLDEGVFSRGEIPSSQHRYHCRQKSVEFAAIYCGVKVRSWF